MEGDPLSFPEVGTSSQAYTGYSRRSPAMTNAQRAKKYRERQKDKNPEAYKEREKKRQNVIRASLSMEKLELERKKKREKQRRKRFIAKLEALKRNSFESSVQNNMFYNDWMINESYPPDYKPRIEFDNVKTEHLVEDTYGAINTGNLDLLMDNPDNIIYKASSFISSKKNKCEKCGKYVKHIKSHLKNTHKVLKTKKHNLADPIEVEEPRIKVDDFRVSKDNLNESSNNPETHIEIVKTEKHKNTESMKIDEFITFKDSNNEFHNNTEDHLRKVKTEKQSKEVEEPGEFKISNNESPNNTENHVKIVSTEYIQLLQNLMNIQDGFEKLTIICMDGKFEFNKLLLVNASPILRGLLENGSSENKITMDCCDEKDVQSSILAYFNNRHELVSKSIAKMLGIKLEINPDKQVEVNDDTNHQENHIDSVPNENVINSNQDASRDNVGTFSPIPVERSNFVDNNEGKGPKVMHAKLKSVKKECPKCGKYVKFLKNHVSKLHTEQKKCPKCGKFVKHMNNHLFSFHRKDTRVMDIDLALKEMRQVWKISSKLEKAFRKFSQETGSNR